MKLHFVPDYRILQVLTFLVTVQMLIVIKLLLK